MNLRIMDNIIDPSTLDMQCIQNYTKDLAVATKEKKTLMNFDGFLYIIGSTAIILFKENSISSVSVCVSHPFGFTTSNFTINPVPLRFIKSMNKKLCQGEDVVQGYRDIKNPTDSWVSAGYAIFYWTMNRFYHLARYIHYPNT